MVREGHPPPSELSWRGKREALRARVFLMKDLFCFRFYCVFFLSSIGV